jgi:transcription elongation factor GreA
MSKLSYFTQESYDKFKEELTELKTTGRKEAARAIAEAREKGDLSENAEYDAAREAQGLLELKISQMEEVLLGSRVLDEADIDLTKVAVLTKVRILNTKTNKEISYKLVSETEADLKLGKISVSSPIGKGLLGKGVGEMAEITTPSGLMQFKVLEISL